MSLEDKLLELVTEAAEFFGWEEFDEESDVEILESEEFSYPFADMVQDDGVYRLFVTDFSASLSQDLSSYFDHFRDLESEYDSADEVTLVWRSAGEEDDFWYLRRTDDGEIGLFHSDFSLDDADEDEEEEEDD